MVTPKRTIVKRDCPACVGRKMVVSPFALKQDPGCLICHDGKKSRGYVLNVVCKGCGRSAYEEKEGVYYCGREACWTKVKPVKVVFDRSTTRPDLIRFQGFNPWQRIKGESEEEHMKRIEEIFGEGGYYN